MVYFFNPPLEGKKEADFIVDLQLGRGANAIIYEVLIAGKRFAFKKYHNQEKLNLVKLNVMAANQPATVTTHINGKDYSLFAWPLSVVYSDKQMSENSAVGFIMPLIEDENTKTLDYFYDYNLITELKNPSNASLSIKIEILNKLARLMSLLHQKNHFFVDLKPQNIKIYEDKQIVSFLDCDGYSISDQSNKNRFPSEMVSTDYISPEVSSSNFSVKKMELSQDLYALAVIFFQFLNNGIHPFQGILKTEIPNSATNDQKAFLGLYPHGYNSNDNIDPRPQSVHETFLDKTRELFDRAFTIQDNRPSADEWASHFHDILIRKEVVRCSKFPDDYLHMRFKDKQCPTCHKLEFQASLNKNSGKDFVSTPFGSQSPKSPTRQIAKAFGIIIFIFFIVVILASILNPKYPRSSGAFSPSNNSTTSLLTRNTDFQICFAALDQKRINWDPNPDLATWVQEAKDRRLGIADCQQKIEFNSNFDTLFNPLKQKTDMEICAAALDQKRVNWDLNPNLATWVQEAKDRRLGIADCQQKIGFNSNVEAPINPLKQKTDMEICAAALDQKRVNWDLNPNLATWVQEAKDRRFGIADCQQKIGFNASVQVSVLNSSDAIVSFDLEDGWDIWGHDIGPYIQNITEDECKKNCNDNPVCNAFVYNYSIRKGNSSSACYLKSNASMAYRMAGVKIGIAMNKNSGFNFFDEFTLKNDAAPKEIKYLKKYNTNLDQCMLDCHLDDACYGFDYEKNSGICYTLANDFTFIKSVGDISSRKN